MQGQSTNLCSSRSTTSPNPAVSVVPTRVRPFCAWTGLCFLRVVVPLHLVCPFLSWCLPFPLFLFLPIPLPVLAFALAFVLLAFVFVVHARQSTRSVVLQIFGFLSTVSRLVTVNSTP